MKQELRDDIEFYLDRLHYYNELLKYPGQEQFPGFGEIPFEHADRATAKWTYEFWLDGLVGMIMKDHQSRKNKKETKDEK